MAARLIKRRGGHRAEATKLSGRIETMCTPNQDIDLLSLRNARNELCRRRDIILILDNEILDDDDTMATDITAASMVSMDISQAINFAAPVFAYVN